MGAGVGFKGSRQVTSMGGRWTKNLEVRRWVLVLALREVECCGQSGLDLEMDGPQVRHSISLQSAAIYYDAPKYCGATEKGQMVTFNSHKGGMLLDTASWDYRVIRARAKSGTLTWNFSEKIYQQELHRSSVQQLQWLVFFMFDLFSQARVCGCSAV